MQTVTRAHLAETIYAQVGLSRNESADLWRPCWSACPLRWRPENPSRSVGSGHFLCVRRAAAIGRNPKTGKEVPIMPRRVLVFRPSHVLKARVNGTTPRRRMTTNERPGR